MEISKMNQKNIKYNSKNKPIISILLILDKINKTIIKITNINNKTINKILFILIKIIKLIQINNKIPNNYKTQN